MQTAINLIKGDRVASNTDYRDALPVNMTAVMKPILGAVGYMIQEPGLTMFGSGSGFDRGANWNERFSLHLRVSGGSLISVLSNSTSSVIGAISGSQQASMPYSFNTQGVITDGKFYLYSPSLGLQRVTDPDLGSPIDGVWVDGYYFLTDGEYLFHTDIDDEFSIDPLKFATSEFSPDPTYGVGKTQDDKVVVFNRFTTEYFVNSAQENFAFQRIATRSIKIGIVGTHCKCEVGESWFILGGRKEESVSVHQIGVGSAAKIATREVDKIIGTYAETDLRQSVLESYSEDGYDYLIIHLPMHVLKFNYTLAKLSGIDFAWSILKSDVVGDNPWRAKNGVFDPRLGEWIFGDKGSSNIAILDARSALQYGNIVEWDLFTPFLYIEAQSVDLFAIQTIPGFTETNDATVFISMTYNGITYGKEITVQYGKKADYGRRFEINRLGYIRDWFSFRIRGASRSRMAFATAWIMHG